MLWSWGTGGPLSRAGPGCLIPLSLLLTLGNWTASLPTHPRPPGAGSRRRAGWVSRFPESEWRSRCVVGICILQVLHLVGRRGES